MNLVGPRMFNGQYGPCTRYTRDEAPLVDGWCDSGAFNDAPEDRLTPDAALERQLLWEVRASEKWNWPYRHEGVVSYDLLIDEKWTHGRKKKERWTVRDADAALEGLEGRVGIKRETEKSFMGAVIALANVLGWRCYHTHDSRRSEPGFPDLVLVRGSRIICAELKTDRGKLSPAQDEWLALLRNTRAEVFVWRPSDWTEITKELAKHGEAKTA